MNLWAKSLGRLALFAVALFFFSCEEESNYLGFKNPSPKFTVSYFEMPVPSTVMLVDSLRTSNFTSLNETNRLLVGKYFDDRMGEVTAATYAQYFTSNTSKALLKDGAQLDSVSMDLRFDFYSYGSGGKTTQTISIHELKDELIIDSAAYLFNRTNTAIDPTPLGTKSFSVDPAEFKSYLDNRKDTTLRVHVHLDYDFGKKIFASALKYKTSTNDQDSTFARFSQFVKEFKGIAVVPGDCDKVVGFNPASTVTRITLHYHDATTDSLELVLNFSGTVSYNQITSDRSSTELAGLTQYHEEFQPASDLRYVQAGTGIATTLDLGRFYEFVDADTNANMLINSAELIIEDTEPAGIYDPIGSMNLVVTESNNRFKKVADSAINRAQYEADLRALAAYSQFMGLNANGFFTPIGDERAAVVVTRSEEQYSTFMTQFAQEMAKKETDKPRFRYFTLYPAVPQPGKSVNRLIFNKNAVKFRVYYTRPTGVVP